MRLKVEKGRRLTIRSNNVCKPFNNQKEILNQGLFPRNSTQNLNSQQRLSMPLNKE